MNTQLNLTHHKQRITIYKTFRKSNKELSSIINQKLKAKCLMTVNKESEILVEMKKALDDNDALGEERNKRIRKIKRLIVKAKESVVHKKLADYCEHLVNTGIQWEIQSKDRGEKTIYYLNLKKGSLQFFASQLILQNLKHAYGLNQPSRKQIVSQIISLLDDSLPKSFIRTDIVHFYESIPTSELIKKIDDDGLLPISQVKAIKNALYLTTKDGIGVPRGLCFSAYLADLYLREFDRRVKEMPNVIYYARYVDDIFLLVKEKSGAIDDEAERIFTLMNEKIKDYKLELHNDTKKFKLGSCTGCDFSYLGYKFANGGSKKPLEVSISKEKIDKYLKKIDLAFWSYHKEGKLLSMSKRKKLLVNRIYFLCSTVPLGKIKKSVSAGLPVNYSEITSSSCLAELDDRLHKQTNSVKIPDYVRKELQGCSFTNGFERKTIKHFTMAQLTEITRIWKKT